MVRFQFLGLFFRGGEFPLIYNSVLLRLPSFVGFLWGGGAWLGYQVCMRCVSSGIPNLECYLLEYESGVRDKFAWECSGITPQMVERNIPSSVGRSLLHSNWGRGMLFWHREWLFLNSRPWSWKALFLDLMSDLRVTGWVTLGGPNMDPFMLNTEIL